MTADTSADARRSTVGTPDGFVFDIWLTKLRLAVGNPSVSSAIPMPIGKLTHVAGTFDGTTQRVYIDGTENAAMAVDSGALPAAMQPLRIAGDSNQSSRYIGLIDELAIYSRALARAALKAIYEAGAWGRCKR